MLETLVKNRENDFVKTLKLWKQDIKDYEIWT